MAKYHTYLINMLPTSTEIYNGESDDISTYFEVHHMRNLSLKE